MSPLYLAARKNKLDIVEYLLKFPKVVEDLNKCQDNNALIYAVKTGTIPLTTLLLENGADNKIKIVGEDIPIMIAITKNNQKMVNLIAGYMTNVDIDIGTENITPFYYAVMNNQLDIAQTLLQNGASHYWRNKHMEQIQDLLSESNSSQIEFLKKNKIWKDSTSPEPVKENNIRPESDIPQKKVQPK